MSLHAGGENVEALAVALIDIHNTAGVVVSNAKQLVLATSDLTVTDAGSGRAEVALASSITTAHTWTANQTFSAQILAKDGTVSSPGWSFSAAPNWGIYRNAGNNALSVTIAGAEVVRIGTDQVSILSDAGLFRLGALADVVIARDDPGVSAFKNGTTAQEVRVYGTTTGPKYGFLKHDGMNVLIGGNSGSDSVSFQPRGTTQWRIDGGDGQLSPQTGNAVDLGASTVTVRAGWFGTSVTVGTRTVATSAKLHLAGTTGQLILDETDAGVDAKMWDFICVAGELRSRTLDDANSLGNQWLSVTRSGASPGTIAFSSSGLVEIKNLGVAQELRVYGTTTGPKYLSLKHDGTNVAITTVSGGGILQIYTGDSSAVRLGSNGATQWNITTLGIEASSNVRLSHGTSALATTATEGFFHIQSCAGTPTGVPASIPTGQIPAIYDTTAHKIWFYSGSWRGVAVT